MNETPSPNLLPGMVGVTGLFILSTGIAFCAGFGVIAGAAAGLLAIVAVAGLLRAVAAL